MGVQCHHGTLCTAGQASPRLLLYIYQGSIRRHTLHRLRAARVHTGGGLSATASRHCRGKKHTRAGLNIVASYHSNGMVIRLSPARQ